MALNWYDSIEEQARKKGYDKQAIERQHEKYIEELKEMGFSDNDVKWITVSDAVTSWEIRKTIKSSGFDSWLDEANELKKGRGKIVLPNQRLGVIWQHEIIGQISDGIWEGDRRLISDEYGVADEKWRKYTDAPIEVIPNHKAELQNRVAPKLDFSGELLKNDGLVARMIYIVRMSGIDTSYNQSKLREDVEKLDSIEKY